MTTLPETPTVSPMENENTILRNGTAKKPKLTHAISEAEIREEFSHHQRGVARINNGSFGSCPRSVLNAQSIWQLRFLQHPDDFYFNSLRPGILAMVIMFIASDT